MSKPYWADVSYFDAIRPGPGWQTEYALLASYSADPVALAATLLALAGLDDDRGSGSRVDFASAVTQLAGRVRLISQAGRLIAPHKTPKILAILDRYVREVRVNESEGSWHPKAAVCKQISLDGSETQWRVWIGSRNLTRDLSWDIGMTMVGRGRGPGKQIPGIAELGQALARHADMSQVSPAEVAEELSQMRWEAPPGCSVKSLHLLDRNAVRLLPDEPPRLNKLVVVSPYLDGTIIGTLGKWGVDGNTDRTLVSTRPELAKLVLQQGKPLAGFQKLLFLDLPDIGELEAGDPEISVHPVSHDEEPEPRGLHAKLIYAETSAGRRHVWTGSSNATQRGWRGPNTELLAELEISVEIAKGLSDFIGTAYTVDLNELKKEAPEPDSDEKLLERARKHVAGHWQITQTIQDGIPVLKSPIDPTPEDPKITLSVGLLGAAERIWPRGQFSVQLPWVSEGEITELIRCELTRGVTRLTWFQCAPLDPPPGETRDRKALAQYLGPRSFLMWIKSLLSLDSVGDGGGDWDDDRIGSAHNATVKLGPTSWVPTLEEILRSWSRDSENLAAIDKQISLYLKIYREQEESALTPEDRKSLESFENTWKLVASTLIGAKK